VGEVGGHSMIWSARARSDCGIATPSAFAVFEFTLRTNFSGRSTGNSLIRAPRPEVGLAEPVICQDSDPEDFFRLLRAGGKRQGDHEPLGVSKPASNYVPLTSFQR